MEVEHTGARSGISWPAQPGALVDTGRCPSCFTAITVSPCPACGLDLTDARTARVLDLSQRIVALVDERAAALLLIHRSSENAISDSIDAPEREPAPRLDSGAAAPPSIPGAADEPVGNAPSPVLFPPPAGLTPPTSERPPLPVAPTAARAGDDGDAARSAARAAGVASPAAAGVASAAAASPTVPVAPAPVAPHADSRGSVHLAPSADTGARTRPVGQPSVSSGGGSQGEPATPRRSSVQVFLLSTGVVLLAVAAVFFLTVAWISGGLVLRSVIIGLVTAAVIATASLLRRRRLEATAEGISLLGIALVALDVWAVRANDLGGAASVDPAVYWGAATTAAGVAFVGWARLARLRAPLSTAVLALTIGPALLGAGLVGPDSVLAWFVAGLIVVLVALAAPFAPLLSPPPRARMRPEIVAVRVLAALAGVVALAAALFVDPQATWSPVLFSGLLALALAAHAGAMTRRGESRLAPVAAVAAVLCLGSGVAVSVVRAADATLSVTVPVIVAVVVAVALDVAGRRADGGPARSTLLAGAVTAAVIAGLAALAPIGAALTAVFARISDVMPIFGRSALDIDPPDATATAAVIALAAVAILAAAAWRLSGAWRARRLVALAAGASVALLVGPQLRVLLLVVAWYLVLAVIAVVVLLRRRGALTGEAAAAGPLATAAGSSAPVPVGPLVASSDPSPAAAAGPPANPAEPSEPATTGPRAITGDHSVPVSAGPPVAGGVVLAILVGTISLLGGLLLSFASPLAWAVATVVVTGVIAVAAGIHRLVRVAATVAVVGFVSTSALLLPLALRSGVDVSLAGGSPSAVAAVVAAGCLVFVGLPVARRVGLDAAQRAAGALTAIIVTVLSSGAALMGGPPAADAWIAGACLAAAVVTVVLTGAPGFHSWRIVRPAAALTAPLFAAAGVDAVLRAVDAPEFARMIVAAALGVVAVAVALRALGREPGLRVLTDAGAGLVLVLAVAAAPSEGARWLPLLLAAVAALLWATDSEGLLTSNSGRRHLVWLALLVGAIALWSRLLWQGTDTVEFFTLPVGVALLTLAAGTERARRRRPERPVATPAVIAAAGVGVALLPTALADPDDLVRAVIAGVLAVVLVVGGAWLRPARTPDALPVAVAAAAALTLVVCVVVRVAHAIDLGATGSPATDAVLLLAALALAAAAVGVSRRAAAWSVPASRGIAIAALALFALGEAALVATAVGPILRVVLSIAALGAVGILLLRRESRVWSSAVVGVALGGAALVGAVALATGVRPLEWATVPLALVLLTAALSRWSRPLSSFLVAMAAVGLATGLLPSAALAGGSPTRAIGVVAAAALVLAAAPRVMRGPRAALLVPAVVISGAALGLAAMSRALHDVRAPFFDVWALTLFVCLVGAAVLLLRRSAGVPSWVPPALAVYALALTAALSVARMLTFPGPDVVRVVVALAVILGVGLFWRGPHRASVWWAALGLAVAVGVTAVVAGAADPIETATVPIAAALLANGVRSLRTRAEVGSWPAVGAGLGVLLIPSLLFDFVGDSTLWRVIGLGVVALVALLWGVRRRLQAPVVLGGVVLIVHAVAQLWPWITALYESASGLWWLWLGIAGALLIVIAATYERRIREVKAVALALRALR